MAALTCAQVNAIKKAGLYEKTVLVLTSKHGNSPIDHSTLVRVPPKVLPQLAIQPMRAAHKQPPSADCVVGWTSKMSVRQYAEVPPRNCAMFHPGLTQAPIDCS